jgi:hypothetical protein
MSRPAKRQKVAPLAPLAFPASTASLLTLPEDVLDLVLTAAYDNSAIARLPALSACRGLYKNQSLWGTAVRLWHDCRPDGWLQARKSITDVVISEHVGGEGISATLNAIRGAGIRKLDICSGLDMEVATRGIWHYLKDLPLTHLCMVCLVYPDPRLQPNSVSLEGIRDALPGLRSLEIYELPSSSELTFLFGLPLEHLRIRNPSTLQALTKIAALPLTSLDIRYCRYLRNLDGLRGLKLTKLNISHCRGLTPDGISALVGMPLVKLVYKSSALDAHMATIALLAPTLVHLNLSESGVTDAGLRALRGMRLKTLSLRFCKGISAAGLAHLADMPLECLHLFSIIISDAGLLALRGLKLRRLVLSGCEGISAAGLAHLVDMPLELLDLRYTGIKLQDCPPNLRSVIRH